MEHEDFFGSVLQCDCKKSRLLIYILFAQKNKNHQAGDLNKEVGLFLNGCELGTVEAVKN